MLFRSDFLKEVDSIGQQYNELYKKAHAVPASVEVRDEENFTTLKVIAKYLDEDAWKTDERYFYFYRPDRRLNLMITGKDEDLAFDIKDLRDSLRTFGKVLRIRYTKPIDFQIE